MGVLEENNVFQVTPKPEKGPKTTTYNSKEEKTKDLELWKD